MKRIISTIFIMLMLAGITTGCSKEEAIEDQKEVLVVNKEDKEVKIIAVVNGKYFTEATRHGVVAVGGSNADKSVLRGEANEIDFHEALMEIGAKPGDNVKLEDMSKGVKVDGEKLDVFVTWKGLGKEIPFNDIIKSSDERDMDIRFGGNLVAAKDKKTGCILCLDSCAVGITSNSSYETGSSKTVQFFGDPDVLPKDGTKVTVIFRIAK